LSRAGSSNGLLAASFSFCRTTKKQFPLALDTLSGFFAAAAMRFGIEIPPTLLAIADEVIASTLRNAVIVDRKCRFGSPATESRREQIQPAA
jgi:hypothetical protein